MNTILRDIVDRQTVIQELKKLPMARKAVEFYASQALDPHVKDEMKRTAKVSGVPYFDILCVNLSYEIAILATTPGEFDLSGLWKSLSGVPATRVGCTSFAYWTTDVVPDLCGGELRVNGDVTFARNLDWPDPDGLLKKHTFLQHHTGGPVSKGMFKGTKTVKPFQSLTFPGYSGVLTGYAPGRFAIALNAVMNDGPITMGAAPSFLTRKVMEECETFEDAMRMLARTPLVCGALFTLVNGRECAGKSSAVVVERSASKYAIRRAEQFGDDFVVVATNDYISMNEFGTSAKQLASDIGASSCKRYNGVLDGIKAAREILEIPQGYPIPRDEIRAIMRDQEFGCTIHAALFDMDSDTVKWD
jgi:hypothetical protein